MRYSSFRDPAGNVFVQFGRVFRKVSPEATTELREFLKSSAARGMIASGKVIATDELSDEETENLRSSPGETIAQDHPRVHFFEHERVIFPSYPYEWPPDMLFAAGSLTLELAEAMLGESFSLKDATPYNVLFRGPSPVFVDVLSFEKRTPGDPRWLPYGQFVRTFILPLLMTKSFGTTGGEIFLTHRDGLEPEQVYAQTTWPQRLRPPYLTAVSIPAWLGRKMKPGQTKVYRSEKLPSAEKADFILRAQLRRARKLLQSVKPGNGENSNWAAYTKNLSYSSEDFVLKAQLVRKWLAGTSPASVLDIGCNDGTFSQIAAETGARVVAIDLDPVVVGMTWRRAAAANLNILPLVVNFGWPTPATGWRNAEYPSFLDRAANSFDTVMMLAILHHLLVTERIPLEEIVNLCRKLTRKHLIIEYVSKDDEMFGTLTRGRASLHAGFTQEYFEAAFSQGFTLVEKAQVKGNLRWLYFLEKTLA